MRIDMRKNKDLRDINIVRNYLRNPHGSVLISWGETKVICSAMVEDKAPPFLKGTGKGWISAEYNMLPASTSSRKQRKTDGRGTEIQRLIGRSLRSVADLYLLEEKTIWIDCDVIQADGGTRVACITGAFVALYDAVDKMLLNNEIENSPLRDFAAAVSIGIVGDEVLVDLCYEEDSNASADMNVVMTEKGEFIEVQATGEECPIKASNFHTMLDMSSEAIYKIIEIQKKALGL